MKFGICLPIRRDTSIEFNIDLALKCEQLGFDSVWVSDHVVVPNEQVGRFTKYFYDPFILLSAIAAKTQTIKVGSSLIILPYRNPVVTAKMISTLDVLSSGRVLFGVATGWLKEEFDSLDVSFEKRGRRTNEYLEAILNLWTEDNPEYKGEFVNFSDISFYPKPFQKPYTPIIVGGNSDYAMKRAAKYGNGWQPTWITPDEMKSSIKIMNGYLEEYGKNSSEFIFSVRNRTTMNNNLNDVESHYFTGSASQISETINAYKEAGVSHILFDPECENDEETFDLVNVLSEIIKDM